MHTPIEPNVGQRIRSLRERRGLSLRALAEQSGLSLNAISLIEKGQNSPTVSSLHRLATALAVPISAFFEEVREQTVVFVRPDQRLGSQVSGLIMQSLGIGLRHQQLEPFLLTLDPAAGNIAEPVTHPGEEFVFCVEGGAEYFVAGQAYPLTAGCSLLFEAAQPHAFHNPTARPARLLIVFYAAASLDPSWQRHLDASLTAPLR
jgi:transcriptional regulator with XRE-family HTH domain